MEAPNERTEQHCEIKAPNERTDSERVMETGIGLASQTFHSAKGEEKSGSLPIPFWLAEFGIILHHVNGMLILCCHVQCPCTYRFW